MGVGPSPDMHLLRTAARLGGGGAERLETARKSTWEPTLVRQLTRCRQPALTALAVHWQLYEDERGRMSAEDEAVFALGTFW